MNIIFLIVYVIWFASEIFINRLLRSGVDDKQNLDKNTLRIIWITIIITTSAAVVIASFFYIPISTNNIIEYIGLSVIILGCCLRFLSIKSLGKQFTADVTIKQNHQLITTGMYKYMRHPSYSASLLSFIGFGLSLNNWISLLIITTAIIIAFLKRIKVEETALINQFGAAYTEYKKNTFTLIPFIP